MDLSNLSAAELKELLNKTALELKNREKKDLEAARNEIYAIAHRLGMPLKSLIGAGSIARQTGKVAVQYRNPSNQEQEWTGRGRQPNWVKELIASGKSLDSARV